MAQISLSEMAGLLAHHVSLMTDRVRSTFTALLGCEESKQVNVPKVCNDISTLNLISQFFLMFFLESAHLGIYSEIQ
jgi:hypothetical protein